MVIQDIEGLRPDAPHEIPDSVRKAQKRKEANDERKLGQTVVGRGILWLRKQFRTRVEQPTIHDYHEAPIKVLDPETGSSYDGTVSYEGPLPPSGNLTVHREQPK